MYNKLREPTFVELIGMFAEAPIGFCCFDTNLHFAVINNYLAQLNGVSVEEHLGRSIHEIIPAVAEEVEAQLRQVIETGDPIVGGTVDAETPAHPGLTRSFQHHYYAIKSEAGGVLMVACVVQEITARRQAEEALDRARGELERRVEERTREISQVNRELKREIAEHEKAESILLDRKKRLRLLLETTNAIPWEADAKTWKFSYVGPQVVELLGYAQDQWLKKNFWVDHLHPEDRAWAADYCLSKLEQNDSYEFEYRMTAADGRSVWFQDIVHVMRQDGAPVILRGFLIDVTERKQAENLLQDLSTRLITAQEEERSRIAREIHDDFNQRLALLAVDIERLHYAPPDSREHLVNGLASLLRRTTEISSGLDRMSRRLHPSILEHLGLVAATRSFCKEISDQHGIHIDFVHRGIPRSVPGDVALCVYRIVQEALGNVIKHSGAKSARVEITKTASELKLQISDSGTGFDPKIARTRRGLGLLSMRERLRQVDGTISFMQIEPTGARVDVRIPVQDSNQP